MTNERKETLIADVTVSLWCAKEIWLKDAGDDANNFQAFHDSIVDMGAVWFDSVELTDDERKMLNADASVSGDLAIVLEYVLGQMWREWN